MKYELERLPESRVAIDVELEPERVEKALDRAARRISRQARVPGFRPGKAPRYIIEARYGRAALYEQASDDLVQQAFKEILEKTEVDPVGQAELQNLSLEPFSFRLVIPVRPTVTLCDYRDLRMSEEVAPVSEEAVQALLEQLQEDQTVWAEPDPARPAHPGDLLSVKVVGRVGEREIMSEDNTEILLGNEQLPDEFNEHLDGVEMGQVVEIEVALSEEIDDLELASQVAEYTITVLAIKEADIPQLDDEFARSFGQEDTLEAMQTRIREEQEASAQKQARENLLERMIVAIVEDSEIDMPQVFVDEQVESSFRTQETQLKTQQISMEQFLSFLGRSEEEYRQELQEQARQRLRRSLVFREIIAAEDLSVSEQEIEEEIERFVEEQANTGVEEKQLETLRQLLARPERHEDLESNLLSGKVEDLLLTIARGEQAEETAAEAVVADESAPAEEVEEAAAADESAPAEEVEEAAAADESAPAEEVEEAAAANESAPAEEITVVAEDTVEETD